MIHKHLIFTIFGGTGNLTYNKLIPAFFQLYEEGKINHNLAVVAVGRRPKTHGEFREEIREQLKKKVRNYKDFLFETFKDCIYYYTLDFEVEDHYPEYKTFLDQLDKEIDAEGNRVFYLATAPSVFPVISENLMRHGFLNHSGFKRAVFEKPFGYNIDSARDINMRITDVFTEDNIYRIDHYLGKEMIQNILMIRFTNQIFKSVWNNKSIDNVQITVKESGGVEDRGGYYENSGALRDMIQNHLFQMLAFVAMEHPKHFETNAIRDEKVKVLKNIKIHPYHEDHRHVVLGQYDGYLKENKVSPNSRTETYVALECEIDTPRWKGVPFYLRTGKNLNGKEAEIIIEFKDEKCCDHFADSSQPNLLVLKIQPEEGIYLRINTKKPRSEQELMPVSMDYCQSCNIAYRSPEAYERLIHDIVLGDSTLFTRWDEVEAAWVLVTRLLEEFKDRALIVYQPGTSGPAQADEMLKLSGRTWWDLQDLEKAKFNF